MRRNPSDLLDQNFSESPVSKRRNKKTRFTEEELREIRSSQMKIAEQELRKLMIETKNLGLAWAC